MIEAKVSCDECGTSVILPMKRCYEAAEWRIAGLSWGLGDGHRVPEQLAGREFDLYYGSDAICPGCQAKARDVEDNAVDAS